MKRNFLVLILSLLNILLLAACDIKTVEDGPVKSAETTAVNMISAEILEGKTMNEFSVQLNLPVGQNFLLTRELNNKQELLTAVNSTFLDQEVRPGNTYKYAIGTMENKGFIKIQEISVSVPMDMVIKDEVEVTPENLTNWSHLRNLTFLPNSTLFTNGLTLIIKAKYISAQDGVIQSYRLNSTAPRGVSGRSAGEISIKAEDGTGSLTVNMRGEKGGQGSPGSPGSIQKPGDSGGSGMNGGDTGIAHLRVPAALTVSVYHSVGLGGDGGEKGPGFPGFHCQPHIHCHTQLPMPSGPQGPQGKDGALGQTCTSSSSEPEECSIGVVLN